jgi:hypothetical protein
MSAADRLNNIKQRLAALAPSAQVSRDYTAFNQRGDYDHNEPVFCVVSGGFPKFGSLPTPAEDQQHKFMILGQVKLYDQDSGDALEDAEFALLDVVKQLVQADFWADESSCIELKQVSQSQQQDHPYAWIVCELMFDEL